MLISIIMPVYRTEPFIAEAIESVLRQTYPYWELVIIDDGSPDQAPAIAESYSAKDKRIKVIHQVNQGLSGARNAGIDHSTGEYICFLDSDDFYLPNFLKEMTKRLEETNGESVYCGFIDEKNQVINGSPYAEGNILECYALHKQHIWINAFIIKKSILQKYQIKFSNELIGAEDQEFMIKCGLYVSTYSVKKPLCFYRYNMSSITNTFRGKRVKRTLAAKQKGLELINEFFESKYKKQVINYFKLLHDTDMYNYQKQLWKDIVKHKKFNETMKDLADFGKLHNFYKKHKFKNALQIIIINSQNKILWYLVSLFK